MSAKSWNALFFLRLKDTKFISLAWTTHITLAFLIH